jgi:hypothetical protein
MFDDDQRYYESVSVDLESEEFNKLQYYKNIINHLIEKVEGPIESQGRNHNGNQNKISSIKSTDKRKRAKRVADRYLNQYND